MLGENDQCLLLTLVFRRADGKTLSTCCCVSRQWSGIARQEEFWKDLCCVHWKSSATDSGLAAIRAVGGYQKYYALRVQAQEHDSVPLRRPVKPMFQMKDFTVPMLQMEDFIMFLDITHNGASVCSLVQGGEKLKPVVPVPNANWGMFRFGWEFPDLPFPSVPSGREASKGWREGEVMEFEVSWAVMEKSTCKMLQLLRANKGFVVKSICTFQVRMLGHFCSRSIDHNYVAKVDILCQSTSTEQELQHEDDEDDEEAEELSAMSLQVLKFGLIKRHWRHFTQLEACRYLQYIFDLEM